VDRLQTVLWYLRSNNFWATVCKTVLPMLSDRCLSCPVLSVCLSVTFVHCGQTVGRIKMKLGMQVGLGPGHIVLDGDPALRPPKGHSPHPIFGPYLLRPNGCMDQHTTWYGAMELGLSPGDFVWDGNPAPPQFSAHVHYSHCDFVKTLHDAQSLLVCSSSSFSILCILLLEKV